MLKRRNIIRIDEEKCDGCGQCVTACAEGAIEIIDGKARLVKESYCDGLGACIGECPQGAITIEERDVEEFDPVAVEQRQAALARKRDQETPSTQTPGEFQCPGVLSQQRVPPPTPFGGGAGETPSALTNWPVQLRLVPTTAPYLKGAKLLIAADCAPFAFADFHQRLLPGRILLIGCPKLDDGEFYLNKLTEIFRHNDVESVDIAFMEVPCCSGLVRLVQRAIREADVSLPMKLVRIGIHGDICEEDSMLVGRNAQSDKEDREQECVQSKSNAA